MNSKLSPKERAKLLLNELSIEEKLAQLNCYFPRNFSSAELTDMEQIHPYGIGHITSLELRSKRSYNEITTLLRSFQQKAIDLSPHSIPALIHMEGVSGLLLKGSTSFPSGIARGASWDSDLEYEIGQTVGEQAAAAGISQIFAPVLDVTRDSRFGRQCESYGEEPTLVSQMGTAYSNGLQSVKSGLKPQATAKHFLGFHKSEAGVHSAHCIISERELREVYAKPFHSAIRDGNLTGIMPCYNSINGEPVSCSKEIMTDLLRGELGFDGITVSDYCAVSNLKDTQKVCESYTEAGIRAIEAGMDVELQFKQCYNDELLGKVDIQLLDSAVERVLEFKFRAGLFENPFGLSEQELQKVFSDKKCAEVSKKSARESIVLLKNDGVLPLQNKPKKIAVIGWHAGTVRSQFGGYSHFGMAEGLIGAMSIMAGVAEGVERKDNFYEGSRVEREDEFVSDFEELAKDFYPDMKSLFEEIALKYHDSNVVYSYGYDYAGNDCSRHEEALKACQGADVIIMTLGGKNGAGITCTTAENMDSTNINLPYCQDAFIEKAAKLGIPMVGVHLDGRPVSSDSADKYLNSIIEGWNLSEHGASAITEVISGEVNPSGKLPVTIAHCAGQCPIYLGHYNSTSYNRFDTPEYFRRNADTPMAPRYPFGHGISYTQFEYSDLKLCNKSIAPDKALEVEFVVANTGRLDGVEIVQIYVSDVYSSLSRPITELVGFKRIELKKGEKKIVYFSLDLSQLAFLDKKMKWKIEKGEFIIMIGSSSEDIRLKETFIVTDDLYIDGAKRKFYLDVKNK
ncbi:hypothetical protein M9Y10_000468 [Tritrichomonas musculus]|uniref:beta-glucosidase n=1 Tax=Tritrichomonas musculus TaxID=1915356 RepID=A0ABR2L4B8_9EUKA